MKVTAWQCDYCGALTEQPHWDFKASLPDLDLDFCNERERARYIELAPEGERAACLEALGVGGAEA